MLGWGSLQESHFYCGQQPGCPLHQSFDHGVPCSESEELRSMSISRGDVPKCSKKLPQKLVINWFINHRKLENIDIEFIENSFFLANIWNHINNQRSLPSRKHREFIWPSFSAERISKDWGLPSRDVLKWRSRTMDPHFLFHFLWCLEAKQWDNGWIIWWKQWWRTDGD